MTYMNNCFQDLKTVRFSHFYMDRLDHHGQSFLCSASRMVGVIND